MNKNQLKDIITQEILNIAPDIDENEITMEGNIQTTLEIDSYDFLNILVALNEKLNIEVPESDYAKVDTLKNMIEYFNTRL